MPATLKLLDGLQKGELREYKITPSGADIKVPIGKRWLIMRGQFAHITGTDSWVGIMKVTEPLGAGGLEIIQLNKAAIASQNQPLYQVSPTANGMQSAWSFPVMEYGERIMISGGAGVIARVVVLEWDA